MTGMVPNLSQPPLHKINSNRMCLSVDRARPKRPNGRRRVRRDLTMVGNSTQRTNMKKTILILMAVAIVVFAYWDQDRRISDLENEISEISGLTTAALKTTNYGQNGPLKIEISHLRTDIADLDTRVGLVEFTADKVFYDLMRKGLFDSRSESFSFVKELNKTEK
jgi:hypothetical protein